MSQDNSPPTPPSPTQRRASFAPGQTLAGIFGRSPTGSSTATFQGPIAAAAASAHANQRRRMSVSTLGLSGSPNQTSPFGSRPRKESGSSSADESAIDESGDAPPLSATPQSPFSRRLSFGARAMRDARGSAATATSPASYNGEGFNWSDNMRSRAERTASVSSPVAAAAPAFGRGAGPNGARAPANPAPAEAPIREMPKQPRAPDHFQERILKGDFYMD